MCPAIAVYEPVYSHSGYSGSDVGCWALDWWDMLYVPTESEVETVVHSAVTCNGSKFRSESHSINHKGVPEDPNSHVAICVVNVAEMVTGTVV